MKKAEMEYHSQQYSNLMRLALRAETSGMYQEAVSFALICWDHADGMMQYERKYNNKEFSSIPAIDMVLKHAPILFNNEALETLQDLLKNCKRVERNTSESLGDKLNRAREKMWAAHQLWGHIEMNPGCRQNDLQNELSGEQARWRGIVEMWEKMGLLHRKPSGGSYELSFRTRMDAVVRGKCPSCGEIVEAPKSMLIESQHCPECRSEIRFVLLQPKLNDVNVKE